MKLYKNANAPAGERWHPAKTGLKDPTEVEVDPKGRAGMADLLNSCEREVVMTEPSASAIDYASARVPLDELEQAELRAVAAAAGGAAPLQYRSPFSASTTIAGIDANLCVQALRQMDGENLGKVVAAAIERLAQLTAPLRSSADAG